VYSIVQLGPKLMLANPKCTGITSHKIGSPNPSLAVVDGIKISSTRGCINGGWYPTYFAGLQFVLNNLE
jgi:hypothetical protein